MNILTYIYEKTRSYHFTIIVSLIVIVFSLLAYYAYMNYFAKQQSMKPMNDIANANENSQNCQIYFFHAQWCPHCQKAYPEWTKFATSTHGQVIHGYLVECIEVDCTDDNGNTTTVENKVGIKATPEQTAQWIAQFGINSYPTIKLMKGSETIDFEAKITESSLQKFVNTVL